MNRREFLTYLAALGATAIVGEGPAHSEWLPKDNGRALLRGRFIIDAHAHPDQFYMPTLNSDDSSTLAQINALPMNASSFAALGDIPTHEGFQKVREQIQYVTDLEESGQVKIVRRHSDIPLNVHPPVTVPGAILAVEGAAPLGNDPTVIDQALAFLYEKGVRMLTIIHHANNQFGETMEGHAGIEGSGLTGVGVPGNGVHLIESLISMGIVIDVAHAHYATLADIADIATAHNVPIIDSHTSLIDVSRPKGGRTRTWKEMEMVVATGGVVCTWPLAWSSDAIPYSRTTILDWARENYTMKTRLGSEHIGLGTDGGGVLPARVDGYASILDLPKLIDAMFEVGFKRREVEKYMGWNLFRVLKQCIG
jgi:microsomal dipeptidase-like Zn-dependent dipeptidase